ncbi:MAG: class I SAM-dependent methyltransferase [Sphingobium sp.]
MTNPMSQEEEKQREYYDSIAATYDKHYGSDQAMAYRHAVYDRLLSKIDLRGKKVLDAMCGGGEGSVYLVKRGANVIGLDISPEQCRFYKQRLPEVEVVCRSVLETGFEDQSFDFILTDSLHHLPPYLEKGLEEFHRILKPGGLVCCWEPNADSLMNGLRRLWYKTDKKYFEDNEKAVSIADLTTSKRAPFKLRDVLYGGHVGYLTVVTSMILRIPAGLVKWYAPVAIGFERIFSFRWPRPVSCWTLAVLQRA